VEDAVGGVVEAEPFGVGLGRGVANQVEEVRGGPGGLAGENDLAGAPGVEVVEQDEGEGRDLERLGEVGGGGHGRGSVRGCLGEWENRSYYTLETALGGW
jgi:hypothetical protein